MTDHTDDPFGALCGVDPLSAADRAWATQFIRAVVSSLDEYFARPDAADTVAELRADDSAFTFGSRGGLYTVCGDDVPVD